MPFIVTTLKIEWLMKTCWVSSVVSRISRLSTPLFSPWSLNLGINLSTPFREYSARNIFSVWNLIHLLIVNLRAVVGPDERNFLPGHVREWGDHEVLQEVRSVMAGPVDDSLARFWKNNILEGCRGEQLVNRIVVSSLGMSANPVTIKALRELELVWWILLMIRAPLHYPELLFFGRLWKDPQ